MNARRRAVAGLACALFLAAAPRDASAQTAAPAASERDLGVLYARGQILTAGARYIVFSTGDALALRPGTAVPKGVTLGSVVLVTLDPIARDVTAVALEAPPVPREIPIADVPRQYVVAAPHSARTIAAPSAAAGGSLGAIPGAGRAIATVTLEVTVPTNTPPADDVYVATDRSNYSPSEVRMQRIDSRRFSATVALDVNGKLKYQYTRGRYATVERDRAGGIVEPHAVDRPQAKIEDTVTRWADAN
ncbi:MAG: hypothetical protein NVSMB19_02430 [Vulcanimicrobiaceae bacterium]